MIYKNVMKAAKAKGYSASTLEKAAGIANGTIRRWQWEGCGATVKTISKIAKVLELSVDELIKEE